MTKVVLPATNAPVELQHQGLVCFDCISQALDYRESVEEKMGQRHSILRLAKRLFGVAPVPLVHILAGAGFQIMVQ